MKNTEYKLIARLCHIEQVKNSLFGLSGITLDKLNKLEKLLYKTLKHIHTLKENIHTLKGNK